MDIKTFVQESLDQIIQGIEHAQAQNKASKINPTPSQYVVHLEKVEFDIAVTLEKTAGTNAGIAVFGGAISLGGKHDTNESSETVSRIKFSVPIAFRTSGSEPSQLP